MTAEKVNLVSLGDSIATGTLTPFSRTYSYVFYLQGKFREMGYRPAVYSLARDGDTSRKLLWRLHHSQQLCAAIEKADFITVSIGGNDLMKASSIPGFASINVHTAEHGAKGFLHNWPQCIDRITRLNPGANIVVLNLYNPYNRTRPDRKLHELTEPFVQRINGAIEACRESRYKVADIYSAFRPFSDGGMHRVCCLYPASVMRNPHPTPGGQKCIADLVFDQFEL